MSDDPKRAEKLQAQPIKANPMPEYRFQEQPTNEYSHSLLSSHDRDDFKKLDLSGVYLNLS